MPKKPTTLKDLFEIKIKALYDIETQIVKALPKMIKKASDIELRQALESHLAETRNQVIRLQQIFELLGLKPSGITVEGIRGLIKDASWAMKATKSKEATDTLIISSARYVEHYEMAGYLTAHAWAQELGLLPASKLLKETLTEEKKADELLKQIATERIALE